MKWNKQVFLLFFLLTFMALPSCKKIDNLAFKEIKVGNLNWNDVFFINEKVGYICGGKMYELGLLSKTTDGGLTWSEPDSVLYKACYSLFFKNAQEGYIGGFDGLLGHTTDSAKTFSFQNIPSYLPINDIQILPNNTGLLALGSGFVDGSYAVSQSAPWPFMESPKDIHAFKACAVLPNNIHVVAGYGTILRSSNGGQNFIVVRQNGDFYTGMKFVNDSKGIAVGYQGQILMTENTGSSWSVVKKMNHPFETQDHFLAVDFYDDLHGFAVGESGLMMGTSDGGYTWKKVKQFTDKTLRSIDMLSKNSGVIVAEKGSVFYFQPQQ